MSEDEELDDDECDWMAALPEGSALSLINDFWAKMHTGSKINAQEKPIERAMRLIANALRVTQYGALTQGKNTKESEAACVQAAVQSYPNKSAANTTALSMATTQGEIKRGLKMVYQQIFQKLKQISCQIRSENMGAEYVNICAKLLIHTRCK